MSYMKDVMWLDEYLGGQEEIQSMVQAKVYYLNSNRPTYLTLVLTDIALYVLDSTSNRFRMERYLYKEIHSIILNINAPGDVHGMPHFSLYQGSNRIFLLLVEASDLVSFSKFAESLSNQIVARQGKREVVTGVVISEWLKRQRGRKLIGY